ncbi:hypothetical protein ACKWTF_005883 [Chironomus riparius]
MNEINFFIRLQLAIIVLTISVINCVPNCSSETEIFMQNDNNSVANASVNLIETVINKISYNDSTLPHNVVPDVSNYERDFIKILSEKYLKTFQPFDLSLVPSISTECRDHAQMFFESLSKFEFWALKLHDATARFTSGLLNGNINQLGDFDQCLNVKAPNDEFQGKYCLTYLQPSIPESQRYTNYLRRLLQSHDAFKSNFDDPGHRVPRYSTINFGVCVPSSCSSNDVEIAMKHYTESFTDGTGVKLAVRVESEMCYVNDYEWMSKLDLGTKIAILFCVVLLLLTVVSTVYDCCGSSEIKNRLAVSFSIKKNTKALFAQREQNDIRIAHSIRLFNAVMLLISHKCMALFYLPYSNRTWMTEVLGKPWSVLARAASLYTDPFLMISGMLTAYSLYDKLQKNGKINIWKEYISRYLRIMPSLAFLIIVCTYILPLTGNGPLWNLVISHNSVLCKESWWKSLLFIHNWFGFEKMCMTHTHHVGIDTELFWTSPFLIIALFRWPKRALNVIVILAVLSTIARYYVTYTYEISNYVSFGISVQQLFKIADLMYILPPHRFTVYAMGIILGCFLRKFKDIKLSKRQIKIGWCVSTAAMLISFFGPAPMGDISYKFNATHAAHYAAFAPIGWCLFFAWMILTSHLGYKSLLKDASYFLIFE